jgi:NADH dehydrogenase FAD-containing subunit
MKFLRINDGKCIKIEDVEALEAIDQLNTRVYMHSGGVYEAMFPYETLIMLLGAEEEKPEIAQNTEILKKLNVLSESATNFAG